jgi:hypothetical protein
MQTPARKHQLLALFLAVLIATYPTTARADLFGADIPILTQLGLTAIENLRKVQEQLHTMKATYDETKRLASYAAEARETFKEFQAKGVRMFSDDVRGALDQAFPEVSYFRGEATRGGPWVGANGEYRRMLHSCAGGGGGCIEIQEAASLEDTRRNISATFGTAAANDLQSRVLDEQSALGFAAADSQQGRSQITRQQAAELMRMCSVGKDITACQMAAQLAQIENLNQNTRIADQIAEGNKMQAMGLAAQAAERKAALEQARQREELLRRAVDAFDPAPLQIQYGEKR